VKIIVDSDRTKTLEGAVKLASEYDSTIVCRTRGGSLDILAVSNKLKLKINNPITYDQFLNNDYNAIKTESIIIDHIDFFIAYIAKGTPVVGVIVNDALLDSDGIECILSNKCKRDCNCQNGDVQLTCE